MLWAIFSLLSLSAVQSSASMPSPGAYINSDGSPLLPLIQSATSTLDIEIYTMADPYVRQLLRDALARNVRIRIIKDPNPLEDNCKVFDPAASKATADCLDQQKLVTDVTSAGGTYVPFNKKNLCPNGGGTGGTTCYEHGKIAIADGNTALISTGNFDVGNLCIASEHPSSCNRDYSLIETDGTVVNTLQQIFNHDLIGNSYDLTSMIPSSLSDTLTVSPDSETPILNFINSATNSLEVETQYLKDPQMNAALEALAQRGVKVSVTVASICAFGKPSSADAAEAQVTYSAFDSAGISTAMFDAQDQINGHAGYMHAKVIIVDGNRIWIGSENGSNTSMTENREYGIISSDSSWLSTIAPVVASDHSSPDSETWQQSLTCTKDSSAIKTRTPTRKSTKS